MKIKRWIALLLVAAMLLLAGCSIFISEEDKGNIEIVPQIADVKSDEVTATLYFPYDDPSGMLFLLSGDTRKISIAPNERLEAAVLREMISGPSDGKSGLKTVLNPDISVTSVQVNGEYLFLTLSKEFLQPNGIADGWEQDEEIAKQRNDLQKLVTYSVVNTLLLLGQDYSRVQIMVDKTGDGSGERLTYAELGFV
ncbi:MAG: GerMN domain-containing protein, partial [Christensenellales bacterium]